MTRAEIQAALSDEAALALTVWGEARSERIEGKVAIANVIRTRARKRALSIKEVCLAHLQFSCWWDVGGKENAAATWALAEVVARHADDVIATDPIYRECWWVGKGVLGLFLRDVTHGSDHYLLRSLYQKDPPSWAAKMQVVAAIGQHVFLKEIDRA